MAIAGTVVVLNAPADTDLRPLVAALQTRAALPFVSVGLHLLEQVMMPPTASGARRDAATRRRYLEALHLSAAAHARAGCHVLIDHALLDADWRHELATLLDGVDSVWIDLPGAPPGGAPADLTAAAGNDDDTAAAILAHLEQRPMRGQPRARWVPTAVPRQAARPGRIIALVGSSSAGKSTLCRAVQGLVEARHGGHVLYMGIDTALETLSPRYFGTPFHADELDSYVPGPDGRLGFSYVPAGPSPNNASPYPQSQCGAVARTLISGQLNAVAALSRAGLAVVGDNIWIFRDWYDEARRRFADLPVLWVGVTCSDAVVREHEQRRGDRIPGWALGQRAQMYDAPVDLVIDTGAMTPEAEAERILDALQRGA